MISNVAEQGRTMSNCIKNWNYAFLLIICLKSYKNAKINTHCEVLAKIILWRVSVTAELFDTVHPGNVLGRAIASRPMSCSHLLAKPVAAYWGAPHLSILHLVCPNRCLSLPFSISLLTCLCSNSWAKGKVFFPCKKDLVTEWSVSSPSSFSSYFFVFFWSSASDSSSLSSFSFSEKLVLYIFLFYQDNRKDKHVLLTASSWLYDTWLWCHITEKSW